MKTKKRSAFTLVELLMATTLTAMVMGGAFLSLSIVLKAYKDQSSRSNLSEISRLILERMRTDIKSTFLSPHADRTRFVGMDEQVDEFEADTLTFISSVNDPKKMGGVGTSDLAEIQYYIDHDPGTPERWLLRRFDATPDDDPFTGGEVALLGPRAVFLDFKYFDGEEMLPMWDSDEGLPLSITVTLGLFEADYMDEQPTMETIDLFTTTVYILCYRIPPEEDGSLSGGGG